MAWVESHQEVGQHPKTLKAAKRLGINVPQMVGHLHLLWHWALAYADDGDLSRWDDDDVALGAQWDGDSGKFVCALIDVGFIDEADGGRWLHDWMEYAGRLVRERERKRAARSKPQATDPPPDSSLSADCPRTGGGHEGDGPRAGTQPNPTQPNQPPPGGGADPPAATNGHDKRSFTDRCADWLDSQGITLPPADRQLERRRMILQCALDEAGDDRQRQREASMGIVRDYVADLTGSKIPGEAGDLLARLVGDFGGVAVLDAVGEAMVWGAGLGEEYRDDPLALAKYVSAVLRGERQGAA